MDKKKILLVVGSLNQGGAEFQLLSLARLLQSRGFNVEVLALTDYDYFLPVVKEYKLRYSCIENKGTNIYRIWKAVRAIRSKKPGLVISYIKNVSLVAILARFISGFKYKLIVSERTSEIKPWHDLFYFNLALFANKITVNSISKLNYIKSRFPLLSNKAVFMPNIIDVKRFWHLQHIPATDNIIRLSYVGRISPEKNLLNLLKAIAILISKSYTIKLVLTGAANNKAYLTEIQQQIIQLNIGNSITFTGPLNDVKDLYSHTDLLCLVSIFEGFSNVLSEGISCGIPLLASDIEENRYLVQDNENGFLIQPGDPENIAAGIEKFLTLTDAQKSTISANNKAKAQELFDEEIIYGKYLDIFKQIGL